MTAYMIAEITVRDPQAMAEYRVLARAAIEQYGGTFLVRGGALRQAEGERADGEVVVVVAFPTMAALEAWYGSPEYATALARKDQAMSRRVTFVEGVAP